MRQSPPNLSQFSPDHIGVNTAQPALYLSVTNLAPKGDWLQNPKGDKRTNDGPLKNISVLGTEEDNHVNDTEKGSREQEKEI